MAVGRHRQRAGRDPPVHGALGLRGRGALVRRDPPVAGLLAHAVDQDLARRRLRAAVLRAPVREPRDRAADPPRGDRRAEPARPPRARARRDRAVPSLAPAAWRRCPGVPRRPVGQRQLADVPVVAQRERGVVREPRALVRPRPRLLRVLAPVAPVHAGVAVLVADRRDAAGRDRPRVVGRYPAAGAGVRRQGDPRRARTPVGAARPRDAREGLGVLAGSVRPPDLAARGRRGRELHRGEGAAARAELPRDRRGDLRGAVLHEHPDEAVGIADRGGRAARDRVRAVGHGVPGVRAAVQGQAERATARTALHRRQHRGDVERVRAQPDRPTDTQHARSAVVRRRS